MIDAINLPNQMEATYGQSGIVEESGSITDYGSEDVEDQES